ncbi:hypothetical protein [Pseudonocardia phyllosphaerae]|uniref:hypothetical protein n=1 Tax=Pseudonocardia phyllosphaerae TaxID=3390502 RepID=UPI00397BDBD0
MSAPHAHDPRPSPRPRAGTGHTGPGGTRPAERDQAGPGVLDEPSVPGPRTHPGAPASGESAYAPGPPSANPAMLDLPVQWQRSPATGPSPTGETATPGAGAIATTTTEPVSREPGFGDRMGPAHTPPLPWPAVTDDDVPDPPARRRLPRPGRRARSAGRHAGTAGLRGRADGAGLRGRADGLRSRADGLRDRAAGLGHRLRGTDLGALLRPSGSPVSLRTAGIGVAATLAVVTGVVVAASTTGGNGAPAAPGDDPGVAAAVPTDLADGTTAADPAAFGAVPGFRTPSGNIACRLDGSGARCDVTNRTWTPPTDDCPVGDGTDAGLVINGGSARASCGGAAVGPGTAELGYGERLTRGDVTCVSRRAGVECRDGRTGHGFTAARASYRIY